MNVDLSKSGDAEVMKVRIHGKQGQFVPMQFLGVHGPPDHNCDMFLIKLSNAMCSSGRICRQYVCGDFNVDINRCDDAYPWPRGGRPGQSIGEIKST
eukprot:1996643-Karenia_brevis.AAC.1